MTVALASLVAASVFGLPDRPVDFANSIPAEQHAPRPPIVDELWAYTEPRRPAILPVLYGTYATVQALDVWTTTRGVGAGARETNPAVASFTGSGVGLTIMKVATTTATIYFVERLSRRNRVGAIVVMAALNGVSAFVVIHNTRVIQRSEARR